MLKEIRYFGLNQWDEMREFIIKLSVEKSNPNMEIYVDVPTNSYVVEWDEELVDLENK